MIQHSPGIRDYLLLRLIGGPASLDELAEAGWPDHQGGQQNPRRVVSVVLHRAARRGAPIARRLSDRRFFLTGPLPAEMLAGARLASDRLARRIGNHAVSRETNVSRETHSEALA